MRKIVLYFFIVTCLLSIVLGFLAIFMRDTIIINIGIKAVKLLHTWLTVCLGLTFLAGIKVVRDTLSIQKADKVTKLSHEEEKRNPLYEEAPLHQKLKDILPEIQSPQYKAYAEKIHSQMTTAIELATDFASVVEENQQPIIQNIGQELVSLRVHILQDAKSIYRRLVIEKDAEQIEAKLAHNDKLLEDADKLILEAVRYIDAKSNNEEIDLKNLTESLRDLIKMI